MHPSHNSQTLLEYHGMFFFINHLHLHFLAFLISSHFFASFLTPPSPTPPLPPYSHYILHLLSLCLSFFLWGLLILCWGLFPRLSAVRRRWDLLMSPAMINKLCVSCKPLWNTEHTPTNRWNQNRWDTERVMIRKDGKREAVQICTSILFSFFSFFFCISWGFEWRLSFIVAHIFIYLSGYSLH